MDPEQTDHLTQTAIAILQVLTLEQQLTVRPLNMEVLQVVQIQTTTAITQLPLRVVRQIRTATPLRAALALYRQLQV